MYRIIVHRSRQALLFLLYTAGGAGLLLVGLLELPTLCVWKTIFHIPCPSCGLTRALVLACHLHFIEAAGMNILFIPLCLGFGAAFICVAVDFFMQKQIFPAFIRLLGSKPVIILSVALMLCSWAYNVARGL